MDDVIGVPTGGWTGRAQAPRYGFSAHTASTRCAIFPGQEVVSVYAVGQKRLMVEMRPRYRQRAGLLTMADGSSWVVENSWVLPEGFPEGQRQAYRYSL